MPVRNHHTLNDSWTSSGSSSAGIRTVCRASSKSFGQVDEAIGGVDATQSLVQRRGVRHVTLDDPLGFLDTGPPLCGVAGQAPGLHRLLFVQRDQPTADVAAATGQEADALAGL